MIVMPMQVAWGDETPPAAKEEPKAEAVDEASNPEPEITNRDDSEYPIEEENAGQDTGEEEPVTE